MAIAGTNIATVAITGGTAGTGSFALISAWCVDPTDTYAYASINWSQNTTISSGISLPQTTLTVGNANIFLSSGTVCVTTSAGVQFVSYTGASGTTLTGCSGGTGTTTGANITQAPSIAQVQLSNMSLLTRTWAILPIGTSEPMAAITYDSIANQLIVLTTGGILYGIPVVAGSPPTSGTVATLNGGSTITNISFILSSGSSSGHFLADPYWGVIWYVLANNTFIAGFYLHDPTGTNPDYTSALHPMSALKGGLAGATTSRGGLAFGRNMSAPPANRVAVVMGSIPGVYRWSESEYVTLCLLDDQGAAQTSGVGSGFSSASYSGPTVAGNMQGLAYDSTGVLYALPSTLTNIAYSCSATDIPPTWTAMNSGSALTHTSTVLVGNPVVVNSANGYTGSGSAYPQMIYADQNHINVCK